MTWLKRIGAVVGVAAAAGVGAVWFVGSALSAPAMRSVGPPPPALHAQPCTFPSASGSTIHGWISPGLPGHGVVVLAHSVRSTRLEMVPRARFLHDAGYSVLLFDAQAHGESPGDHITFGWLEARDARAAVDFVNTRFPGEAVAYLGVSQGGAAALLGNSPLRVQALVLEAVYPSLYEAVVNRISIRLGPLGPLLAPLLLLQVRPRLGAPPELIAPILNIGDVRAPVLLMAGDRDRHTRLEESQRLFEAAPEPKTLWVIEGAAHQDFYRFAPAEYERRVLEFLAQTLGTTNTGETEKPRPSAVNRLSCESRSRV
jgi:uncharacterized protein